VDYYLGVGHRYYIDFAVRQFVLEDGSLLEADADLHLVGEGVLSRGHYFLHFCFDHGLEININLYSV